MERFTVDCLLLTNLVIPHYLRIFMTIKKSHIFLLSCLSFIAGVGLASFLPVEYWYYKELLFLLAFVGVIVLTAFRRKRVVRITALWGLFLFLGIIRLGISIPADIPDRMLHYHGQTRVVIGEVSDLPDRGMNSQQLELSSLRLAEKNKKIKGKMIVTAGLYPRYRYGQTLKIKGKLEQPRDFNGFSYSRYLAKSGIYTVSYYPEITELDREIGPAWREAVWSPILGLKTEFKNILERNLQEPHGSVVKAMVLGDKSALPRDIKNNFARAGISHITAISGMHIGILVAIFFQLLLTLGVHRKKAFYATSVLLVFYVLLVGLPASAVRAGIMGFLVLLAFYLGRLHRMENCLALAAVIMLAVNPKLFRDSVGFQLSFLAVVGIWYFYPKLNRFLWRFYRKKEELKPIFDIIAITISAQVFTLPLIAYHFPQVSTVSLIANLLVLWTLPLVIVLSLAGLSTGLILPSLTQFFFVPVNFLIGYILQLSEFLVGLPGAYLDTAGPGVTAGIICYYAAVAVLVWRLSIKQKATRKRRFL